MNQLNKIFLLLIVLSSGGLISEDFSFIRYLLLMVFIVLVVTNEIKLYKKPMVIILVVCVLFIFQSFQQMRFTNIGSVIKYLMIFVMMFCYAYSKIGEIKKIIGTIYDYIFGFMLIADILFVLIMIGIQLPTIPSVISRDTVFFLQTYTGGMLYGPGWYRNTGIYWEPGMFQVFLNFILILALFNTKSLTHRKRMIHLCLIIATIYTTGSISGYALCIMIFELYLILFVKNNTVRMLSTVVSMFLSIMGIPTLVQALQKKMETSSFGVRFTDLELGWNLVKDHLLLGAGLENGIYEKAYMVEFGIARGNSNGLINLMLACGIIGASIYLLLFVKFSLHLQREYDEHMAMLLVLWGVVSLVSEPITFMPILLLFLGMGASRTKISMNKHMNHLTLAKGNMMNRFYKSNPDR